VAGSPLRNQGFHDEGDDQMDKFVGPVISMMSGAEVGTRIFRVVMLEAAGGWKKWRGQ